MPKRTTKNAADQARIAELVAAGFTKHEAAGLIAAEKYAAFQAEIKAIRDAKNAN